MKKTLASLLLLVLILSETKKNDALQNNFSNTTSAPTNQVALLLQDQCLSPNGYLVSSGGAYKLVLTMNGNLILQVFKISFYFIKLIYNNSINL